MTRSYLSRGEQVVLFALVFIILQEWLRPIMELTGTGYFNYFSIFVAICLVLSLVDIPRFVSSGIKVLYIIWFIEFVYNKFNQSFISFYIKDIQENLTAIFSANWSAVSDSFRTILFFILIWMLVYLIHHWVTVRISIFYFLLLTVFFIATLDTYSEYDGKLAIVKVMIVGLVMTSLLFIKRIVLKRNILIDSKTILKFMIPVVLLLSTFTTAAYIMPKASPQWPDPVPFIKGIGSGEGSLFSGGKGVAQKVGYGNNDEKLGGAFVADDTLVYQVISSTKQYWRVETKDAYTKKGWRNSGGVDPNGKYEQGEKINTSIEPGPGIYYQTATIDNYSTHEFVPYPYGTMSLESSVKNGIVDVNVYNEMIHVHGENGKEKVDRYEVEYSAPIYNFEQLQASQIQPFEQERYVKLPSGMPSRVRELAEQITASATSAYDKAKAIEKYFARNGFTYETENVAVPEKNQDYVDQFLFETKAGYCDNFSSAMVVLLRSVDIPARWVKGFVTGDAIGTAEDGRTIYEITNNEAHSWVEAYIDGVGWMPFEPTIGYSNPASIDYNTSMPEEDQPLEPTEPDELTIDDEEKPETPEPEEDEAAAAAPKKEDREFNWNYIKIPALILLGLLSAVIIGAFFTRKKWLPKFYIYQNNKRAPSSKTYVMMYDRLLKQLSSYGLVRAKNQTLSSYAKKVDRHFESDEMSQLTAVYEKLIYSKNVDEEKFVEMKEIWEYLINRTSG